MDKMTGDDLRAALERLGMRQNRFAELCSTSPVTVNRWLSGRREIPHLLPSWLAMFERLTPEHRKEIWPP